MLLPYFKHPSSTDHVEKITQSMKNTPYSAGLREYRLCVLYNYDALPYDCTMPYIGNGAYYGSPMYDATRYDREPSHQTMYRK